EGLTKQLFSSSLRDNLIQTQFSNGVPLTNARVGLSAASAAEGGSFSLLSLTRTPLSASCEIPTGNVGTHADPRTSGNGDIIARSAATKQLFSSSLRDNLTE